MQAVILAGGLGTRLHSVVSNRPKAMATVAGRPFIDHQLELLRRQNITDVVMCVGYLARHIEEHVGDGATFGLAVRYSREDPRQLLGTGGAILNASRLLSDEFFLMYGDSYLTVDFATVQVWNRARKFSAVMTVLKNRDQWDRSNVRIAGDHVTFYQKNAALGECDYIDYGLSLFRRGIVERYRDASLPLDLGSIQRDLVASGEMGAFEVMDRFYEIGTPVGLMSLNEHLKRRG